MVHKDRPALRQVTLLEAQWSDLPEQVVEEVKQMWREWELGNDWYYLAWYHAEYKEDYPITTAYLEEHDATEDTLIHFWW